MCKKFIYLASFVMVLGLSVGSASAQSVKINFQLKGGPVPEGYLPDYGEVFADRGNGFSYGWNRDIQADSRDRLQVRVFDIGSVAQYIQSTREQLTMEKRE